MSRIIYWIVTLITKLHAKFLSINDGSGYFLTDKQLHFLIIGIFGFGMMFLIQPIVEWLAKKGATLVVTFIYVFTVVIVVSFAIEIGQAYSGTGTMDFYDIASGILGFFVFFAIYIIVYLTFNGIKSAISNRNNDNKEENNQ